MQKALVVGGLLLLASCAEKPRNPYAVMAVPEVEQRINSLNGKIVNVRGWLTYPCGDLSCAIFSKAVKPGERWPDIPYLSIAGETLAEPFLAKYQGREVVLKGVISSQCRISQCTDRAPDITPINIRLSDSAERF